MVIVAQVEDPARQMPLSIKDAKAPTKAKWPAAVKTLNQTWAQMHKGVVFGAEALPQQEEAGWCSYHQAEEGPTQLTAHGLPYRVRLRKEIISALT